MKSIITGLFVALMLSIVLPQPDAHGQGIVTKVTRITSTSVSTNVILEDTVGKVAVSLKKGTFYTRTAGYTGGTLAIRDVVSGKTIWQGPVSAVRVPGYVTDSLKILYIRANLTN